MRSSAARRRARAPSVPCPSRCARPAGADRRRAPAARYGPLLDRAEAEHDLVVLNAGNAAGDDPWTEFCLQQADRILLVAAGGEPSPALAGRHELRRCELVAYDVAPGARALDAWAATLDPIETQSCAPPSSTTTSRARPGAWPVARSASSCPAVARGRSRTSASSRSSRTEAWSSTGSRASAWARSSAGCSRWASTPTRSTRAASRSGFSAGRWAITRSPAMRSSAVSAPARCWSGRSATSRSRSSRAAS